MVVYHLNPVQVTTGWEIHGGSLTKRAVFPGMVLDLFDGFVVEYTPSLPDMGQSAIREPVWLPGTTSGYAVMIEVYRRYNGCSDPIAYIRPFPIPEKYILNYPARGPLARSERPA